jgi:hypothetical protein
MRTEVEESETAIFSRAEQSVRSVHSQAETMVYFWLGLSICRITNRVDKRTTMKGGSFRVANVKRKEGYKELGPASLDNQNAVHIQKPDPFSGSPSET